MSAAITDTLPAHPGWLDWLRRELAPSQERKARTLILICGAVLCVIISMTLQVPQLATSAYMVFFISKETKEVTTMTGVGGLISLTLGIAASLLLYKLTYGHPELRIPAMAIVLFLGMYAARILVIGPLGFLLGFVIAVTQSLGELVPSPEQLVREILWIWVALAYAVGLTVVLNRVFLPEPAGPPPRHLPKPKSLLVPDAFTNPAYVRCRNTNSIRPNPISKRCLPAPARSSSTKQRFISTSATSTLTALQEASSKPRKSTSTMRSR